MMNQQPDKLFREKLAGLNRPVPASAWSRVEANLDKKKNKGLWLKIAASLLILFVASFVIWNYWSADNDRELTSKRIQPKPEKAPLKQEVTVPIEAEEKIPAIQESKTAVKNFKKASPKKSLDKPAESKQVIMEDLKVIQQETTIATISPVEPKLPENFETQIIATTQPTSTVQNIDFEEDGVTLVYSIDEVNAKYLDKKSLADATSDVKKPSTLRKLLDKAYDLKNNQDPFGDLRQKKNEILALNFKSEKQRSQNK
jgi:hypothetical protein